MDASSKMIEQRQILDKAYSNVATKTSDRVVRKAEAKTVATTEVPKADHRDNVHVWLQTYVPDPLYYLILITGIYGVFHKPINSFLTQVLGFNLDDLRNTVKRRKERDKELADKE